ncbi:MAG: hypothetical protein ABI169_15235 [Chitinophagaceae bacterium]
MSVGNWWRYRHVDMLSNTIDTIILKVVSVDTPKFSDTYKCYVYEFSQIVDSAILIVSDSLISYSSANTDYSYFGDFALKLPFSQSSHWLNGSYFDSTRVISYTSSRMVLGKPYNVFFLKRVATSPGFSEVQTLSIAKDIGIVETSVDIFNGYPVQQQDLQLIDYQLK